MRHLTAVALIACSALAAPVFAGAERQAREEFHAHTPAVITAFASIHNSSARVSAVRALGALTADERARLTSRDASKQATKVGIVRAIGGRAGIDVAVSQLPSGKEAAMAGGLIERLADESFVWTTGFSSAGAGAIRLHLRKLQPENATVYIYSRAGEVHGPYTAAQVADGFWTNTVFAEEVFVEVRFRASNENERVSLTIDSLVHMEHGDFAPPAGTDLQTMELRDNYACFQQVPCVPGGEFATTALLDRSRGIGQMVYVEGGSSWVCTGSLLSDQDANSTIPWFLTANHCIGSNSVAQTLEVFWDYRRASCIGAAPSKSTLPRQLGAQLSTTSSHETGFDISLLRLTSTPPGSRWYLGWNASLDAPNTSNLTLYRLHHPAGEPMHYSRELSIGRAFANQPAGYIFSEVQFGASAGGSSGSPLFTYDATNGAQVLGALNGVVAATEEDLRKYCDYNLYLKKTGSIASAYSLLAPFLAGSPIGPGQQCTPGSTTTCLVNNRFSVRVDYNTGSGQQTMRAIQYTPNTGLFWFTGNDNIEILLKMIDACSFNSRFWVFVGGTTNVEVTVTVTDTQNGTVKTYRNPLGTSFGTITDTGAFATCP